MTRIDINCDVGEGEAEESLYPLITSANIACGGHTGTAATMETAVRRALRHGVEIGAHPSYPDRVGFGRTAVVMTAEQIARTVHEQITALARIASELGARLRHVKPHGALYHRAMNDAAVAEALALGVARLDLGLVLVGMAGAPALEIWRGLGFEVAGEGFADRTYEPDGSLRSRLLQGALVVDPAAAAAQALWLAHSGRVQTIGVHSDTPGVLAILASVHRALAEFR